MMTFSTENFQQLDIHVYDDVYQQADALADFVSGSLKTILTKQEQAVLAVSGGRSPVLFFQALSLRELPWQRVCVTLVDERVVAPDSDASNAKLVRSYFLQNHAQCAAFLPWVSDVTRYKENLLALENNLPAIDLAILGLGEDGHTASWLPKSPQLSDLLDITQEKSVLFVSAEGTYDRFSLTTSALQKIPIIILQLSGQLKSQVFQAALLNKGAYPVEAALPFITDVFIGG